MMIFAIILFTIIGLAVGSYLGSSTSYEEIMDELFAAKGTNDEKVTFKFKKRIATVKVEEIKVDKE